jgi:6-phosphogluconolactonase
MNNDPSARRVQILADPAALARAAAEELTHRMIAAVRANGRATVALSGGSTPKALYTLLAQEPSLRERLPWAGTHFFFGDERHVPPDNETSNYRMARTAMFDALGDACPPANIHRVKSEGPDAYQVAADYEHELATVFPAGTTPRFDLILLGMGPDGHTASLFPGTTGLREADKLVCAAWIDKMSTYRITLTPKVLTNASALLFLVAGKDKTDTLPLVLEGPSEPDRFPSQGISAGTGETLWLVDQVAAAKLNHA